MRVLHKPSISEIFFSVSFSMTFCPNLISATWATFSASVTQRRTFTFPSCRVYDAMWLFSCSSLTDHGFDPFGFCLLLHNPLCLCRDQQLRLLALPADINTQFNIETHTKTSPLTPLLTVWEWGQAWLIDPKIPRTTSECAEPSQFVFASLEA